MIQYKQYKIDHSIECISRSSEISNCPVGSELNIHFQDCPFENHGEYLTHAVSMSIIDKFLFSQVPVFFYTASNFQ